MKTWIERVFCALETGQDGSRGGSVPPRASGSGGAAEQVYTECASGMWERHEEGSKQCLRTQGQK